MTKTATINNIEPIDESNIERYQQRVIPAKQLNKLFYSNLSKKLSRVHASLGSIIEKTFFGKDKIQVLDYLGRGNIGIVYKVKKNRKTFAMKIIDPFLKERLDKKIIKIVEQEREKDIKRFPSLDTEVEIDFRRENELIRKVKEFYQEASLVQELNNSKNTRGIEKIIHVYESGEHNGFNYFLMDYIDGITLEEKLARDLSLKESLSQNLDYLIQTTLALEFLEKNNVTHLDIKPSNILIDEEGNVKLSDFGISRFEPLKDEKDFEGTHAYGAIEQEGGLNHYLVCPKTDIYAIGGILYEMITGNIFNKAKEKYAEEKISKRGIYFGIKEPFKTIIKECTQDNISKRPSAEELYEMLIIAKDYAK